MKKKNLLLSILISCAIYIYFYFIFSLNTLLFHNTHLLPETIPFPDSLYLFLSFLLLWIYSYIFLTVNTQKIRQFFIYPLKKKITALFEFLAYSSVLFLLIALLIKINRVQNNLIGLSVILLCFLSLGHQAFKKILIFFGQIIMSIFIFSSRVPDSLDNNKYFQIFTFAQFMSKSEELLNHSKRIRYPFAFILLYIKNLSDKDYSSFITKQLNFLLLENSRNYEPWGETNNKNIFIKALEIKNKQNLQDSIKRFSSLLSRHQFYTTDKPITFQFKIMGLYLNKEYIIKNEFNLLNSPILNFIPYFEKIKTQEKDLELIELK